MKMRLRTGYFRRVFAALIVCGVLGFGRADAQASPLPEAGSPDWCKSAVTYLTRDGLKAYPSIANGMASCGQPMAIAIAKTLRESRNVSLNDSSDMSNLMAVALSLRSPVLLEAAKAIAVDQAASPLARTTGLYLLAGFFGRPLSARPWIGTAAQCATPCIEVYGVRRNGWNSERDVRSFPADSNQRIARAMDLVWQDRTAPLAIRDIARKFRRAMSTSIPLSVPTQAIKVSYICDSIFEVKNVSDEEWDVWIDGNGGTIGKRISGDSVSQISTNGESFHTRLAPLESRRFFLSGKSSSTIRIHDKYRVIASMESEHRACGKAKAPIP